MRHQALYLKNLKLSIRSTGRLIVFVEEFALLDGEMAFILANNGIGKTAIVEALFGINKDKIMSCYSKIRVEKPFFIQAWMREEFVFLKQQHGLFRTIICDEYSEDKKWVYELAKKKRISFLGLTTTEPKVSGTLYRIEDQKLTKQEPDQKKGFLLDKFMLDDLKMVNIIFVDLPKEELAKRGIDKGFFIINSDLINLLSHVSIKCEDAFPMIYALQDDEFGLKEQAKLYDDTMSFSRGNLSTYIILESLLKNNRVLVFPSSFNLDEFNVARIIRFALKFSKVLVFVTTSTNLVSAFVKAAKQLGVLHMLQIGKL